MSLFALLSTPPVGYELVGKRADVTVYRKPGVSGIELFAEGDIGAPPLEVQQVLLDYAHHRRFVKDLAESRIVLRSREAFWVYQRLDLPMIADRDFTLRVTWGQTGADLWTHFVCDNDLGPPPRDGVVRVSVHEGHWALVPSADGQTTRARYQVHLELSGTLPAWMARSGAAKEIPALFEGLRRQVLMARK